MLNRVNQTNKASKIFLKNNSLFTALERILFNDHSYDMLQLLIDNGVNINQSDQCGMTPLLMACHYENSDLIKFLLENGADVDMRTYGETTPFQYACIMRKIGIAKLLFKYGADINQTNQYDATPFYTACLSGNLKVVAFLIEHHADINKKSHILNQSPLMVACEYKQWDVVKFLLSQPNIVIYDIDDYKSVLSIARDNRRWDVVKKMLNHKDIYSVLENDLNRYKYNYTDLDATIYLNIACEENTNPEVFTILCKKKAQILNYKEIVKQGFLSYSLNAERTPLDIAIQHRNSVAINCIIEHISKLSYKERRPLNAYLDQESIESLMNVADLTEKTLSRIKKISSHINFPLRKVSRLFFDPISKDHRNTDGAHDKRQHQCIIL